MKKLFKTEFARNVLKHFSGSAISNLITILALPVLTRLYTPDDFGLFQLMISTALTLSVISSLKLELAVLLPKHQVISDNVFKLALLTLLFTTALFGLLLIIFSEFLLDLLNAQKLMPYVIYIILGIFINGLFQLVQYIPIRSKDYIYLSKSKIAQAGFAQTSSLTAGFLGANFLGLYLSMLAGIFLNVLLLIRNKMHLFKGYSKKRLLAVLRRYKKFPLINTPMTFLNTLANELPVFMFTLFFGPEIVGFYMAANRLVKRPITMISQSLSQVYFQAASEAFHKGGSELLKLYKKTVSKMTMMIALPLLVVLLFAPEIVSMILGDEWRESGVYMQILTFWIFLQTINYTVSTTFLIIDKQEVGFYLIIASLIVRFLAMYVFKETVIGMMIALSISAGLFYLVYLLVMYFFLKKSIAEKAKS
jgi:O-antigen/teichoic acid export membrane protein